MALLRDTARSLSPFLAMAAVVIVVFWRAVFLGHVLVDAEVLELQLPWGAGSRLPAVHNTTPADSVLQFLPWLLFFKDRMEQGELPFWNPYSFCGHPLLANGQSGFLNPFNLVFLVCGDFATAYNLRLILELYAAGLLAYLYLRRSLGIGRLASALGGTIFMLNGVFVSWLEWQWMVGGALWLPLILLLLDEARSRKSPLCAALAGFPVAFSLLGGALQLFLATLLTLLVYSLIHSVLLYRHSRNARAFVLVPGLAVVAATAGVLLASIQLVPTVELLLQSQRGVGLRSDLISWLRAFPRNLLLSVVLLPTFVQPYLGGATSPADLRTLIKWPTFHGNIVEYQGYVGITALALAALATFAARSGKATAFTSLASLTLFLSFATPVNLFLYYRGFFAYAFSMAVLAGLGAHLLLRSEIAGERLARIGRRILGGAVLFAALLLVVSLVLSYQEERILDYLRARFPPYLGITHRPELGLRSVEALYRSYLLTSPSMVLLPLVLGGIGMLLYLRGRGRLAPHLLGLGMFGLAALELAHFGLSFTPVVERETIFPPTATTDFLRRRGEPFRIVSLRPSRRDPVILLPNTHMPYRIQSLQGYDSMFPRRYAELLSAFEAGPERVAELEGKRRFPQAILTARYHPKLLDMLNVKYVLADPAARVEGQDLRRVFEAEVAVYENTDALPRAYVVGQARLVGGKREALLALLEEGFDPRREVILEEHPPEGLGSSEAGDPSWADVVSYSPHRVVIRAHLSRDSFLVLADGYYPGWRAMEEGAELPIYRANYLLRAVRLGTGDHTVEFVYEPRSFRIGAWVSSLTCLSLLLVLGSRGLTRRSTRGRAQRA